MNLPALLSFLALQGIAVCIFRHYWEEWQKPTISSTQASLYKHSHDEEEEEEEIFEVDETKEDYLSQLPDDVLYSILKNLRVRDAARTTILSTRWKYLFASVHPTGGPRTTLHFKCLDMFGFEFTYKHKHRPYYQEKDAFMGLLNQSLELYSGDRVADIEMKCCFAKEFTSEVSHWLRSISRLGVERLRLCFDCFPCTHIHARMITFSLDVLSQASSLKRLDLAYCILLPSPKLHFDSLMTLSLYGVVLESGHLEGIMSSCSNLKILHIDGSKLPYKLRLDGTLTMVDIFDCSGGENIDLHAPYLHTFKCMVNNKVKFRFSFVPALENVLVRLFKAHSKSYIFGDCASHLPEQVKSLTLQFNPSGVIYFPTMFRNLRELRLIILGSYHVLEIVDLSALWCACPLLQDLNFTVTISQIPEDERRRRMLRLVPQRHTQLKRVALEGFYGTEPEMELALYILRNATVLEQMFLSPGRKRYFFYISALNVSLSKTKCNSIQQKLHGQAISREAQVIIQ